MNMNKSLYDEITIRIRPIDGTIRVEEHTGNVISVKNISPDSLVACLQKGIKESRTVRSGFLPKGCISYDVNSHFKTVVLWSPPGYVDFTYHKTVYEHFPVPAMAFSFRLEASGRIGGHRAMVIADETPMPKSQLYAYPFSNMYADGSICVGAANALPLYKDIRTLGTLPYYIMQLPNNDHNYSRSNNKPKLLYRDLLEHLKDKAPSYYYKNILIPINAVLQDFIDGNISRRAYSNAA